jgi:hypothetical protein
MPLRLTVRFASPEAADDTFIHRVRNFAEDLQRAFERAGVAQVENRDAAVTAVGVIAESQRLDAGQSNPEVAQPVGRSAD